jgi:hypothetical protein
LSETVRNRISARLWRLPREFLLALINATAILVIVAAILALLVIVRIDNFAGNVAATMTEAVLSKIDLPSKDVLANLRNLKEEARTLGDTLREIKAGENPILQSEIARLREALTALNGSVDRLANARTILTDEAIGRLGRSVTDTLTSMRGCASRVGQYSIIAGTVTTRPNPGHQRPAMKVAAGGGGRWTVRELAKSSPLFIESSRAIAEPLRNSRRPTYAHYAT